MAMPDTPRHNHAVSQVKGDMGKAAPRAARDPLHDLGYITVFVPVSSLEMANSFPHSLLDPAASSSVKGATTFIRQLHS